jgi:DnaJ homolog subfamily A member 5
LSDDYPSQEDLTTALASTDINADIQISVDDAELLDHLYCVACDKEFKSTSAFTNHESSKKHKQNVDTLKQEMLEEESIVSSENCVEEPTNGVDHHLTSDAEHPEEEPEEEEEVMTKAKNKKSSKKQKKLAKLPTYDSADDDDQEQVDTAVIEVLGKVSDQETGDDWTDTKKAGKKSKNAKSKQTGGAPKSTTVASEATVVEKSVKKSAKTKVKPVEKPQKYDPDEEDDPIDVDHICVTCKVEFDSKNKLFNHLKKVGHGVYIPKPEEFVEKKGKKRR